MAAPGLEDEADDTVVDGAERVGRFLGIVFGDRELFSGAGSDLNAEAVIRVGGFLGLQIGVDEMRWIGSSVAVSEVGTDLGDGLRAW